MRKFFRDLFEGGDGRMLNDEEDVGEVNPMPNIKEPTQSILKALEERPEDWEICKKKEPGEFNMTATDRLTGFHFHLCRRPDRNHLPHTSAMREWSHYKTNTDIQFSSHELLAITNMCFRVGVSQFKEEQRVARDELTAKFAGAKR